MSERERRSLLRELVEVANRLVGGEPSPDVVVRAAADAKTIQAAMTDDYQCEMRTRFDDLGRDLHAYAASPSSDALRRSLREAIHNARGHTVGALASVTRTQTRWEGGGVRFIFTESPDRTLIDAEAKVLSDAYGPRIVANLLRVMAGANRLCSVLHLLKLLNEQASRESVSYERDLYFLAMLSFGYLKEVAEAIGGLEEAGIKRKLLEAGEAWTKMQLLKREWEAGSGKGVRDDIVFHLGWTNESANVVADDARSGQTLTLMQMDGSRKHIDSSFPAAESMLARASKLTMVDFVGLIEGSFEAYNTLFDGIALILRDLLTQCGARLPPTG